jgi:hypothetical protein
MDRNAMEFMFKLFVLNYIYGTVKGLCTLT